MRMKLLVLLCSTLGTCNILAESPLLAAAGGGDTGFFSELPVVLTVSRLEQPTHEAPASVSVITAEEIRSTGARDLGDLLRLLPGFQVADNIFGPPMAVYHGLTSDKAGRMQILIDGRSQYSPLWFGGVNWNVIQVPLEEIERIEVVRGSNSAAFGANAVLGVVNIKTFSARVAGADRVSFTAGPKGSGTYFGKSWQQGEHAFRINLERKRDEGLERFPDARETTRIGAKAEIRLAADEELMLSVGGVGVRQGVGYYPENGVWLGDEPPHERRLRNYFGQAGWTRQLGPGRELAVRYYRIAEQGREKYQAVFDFIPPSKVGDLKATYDYQPEITRDDLEFQFTTGLGGSVRMVAGLGARRDLVSDRQLYGTEERQIIDLSRGFAHGEWRPDAEWLLSAGATAEKDSMAGSSFAPRVAVNWLARPGMTWRSSVARAYRSPSVYEQRANVSVVDETGTLGQLMPGSNNVYQESIALHRLRPEELTSFDIGFLGEWIADGVALDVRAFHEQLKDVVVTYGNFPALPADNIKINGMQVAIKGAEAQARWKPTPATTFWVNHTQLAMAADLYERPNGYAAGPWTGWENYAEHSAPRRQTSVHWWQKWFGGLRSTVSWYQVGAYKWSKNTDAPSYTRLDWRLARPFQLDGATGEVAFNVRAAGKPHAEYRDLSSSSFAYNRQLVEPVTSLTLSLQF